MPPTLELEKNNLLVLLDQKPLKPRAIRDYMADLQLKLKTLFEQGETATSISHYRCQLVDTVLTTLWQQTIELNSLSLLAVGGYGRAELQPGSDIDLLIIAEKESQLKRADEQIRRFITLLWDIGLEVGQSVRTLAQCAAEARKDITVITAMMEARDLCGKPQLETLATKLSPRRIWPSRKFFLAKLEEQRQRHREFGESGFLLEPNIKESPGGLRDLQTILWVAMRHYRVRSLDELVDLGFLHQGELETLLSSRELLWWIRTGLHVIYDRKDDQLLFDQQRELAAMAGYRDRAGELAVEAFMKSYYQAVTELRRLNEMLLQKLHEEILMGRRSNRSRPLGSNFQLRRGHIEAVDPKVFERQPQALLEIFVLLARYGSVIEGVHAETIRLIRNHCYLIDDSFRADPRCNELFLEFLREPFGVSHQLWRMHRYGVLDRFFPEIERVSGLMQHDLFHVYTVDEHTLWTVRNLRLFTRPEWVPEMVECHDLYRNLEKPELLILAALLHDIGKGLGGNHSQLGAEIAEKFCQQLGLHNLDRELVSWLVKVHLDMSSLSQNADTSDPDIIARFADHVGSLNRLNQLYLLTIADMRATGPTVWNSWKGALLKQLYNATREFLQAKGTSEPLIIDPLLIRRQALDRLPAEGVDKQQAETLWQRFGEEYFLRFSPAEIAWQSKHLLTVLNRGRDQVVATRNFPEQGATGIFVYCRDREYLFSALSGALDRQMLDIVDARILTTADGYAIDTFMVLDDSGALVSDPQQRQRIRHTIRRLLSAETLTADPGSRRETRQKKAFGFPASVEFAAVNGNQQVVMHLTCYDQPGVLSQVSAILADHQIPIVDARINTYGERVEDHFTLDICNLPEHQREQHFEQISDKIRAALDPDEGPQNSRQAERKT